MKEAFQAQNTIDKMGTHSGDVVDASSETSKQSGPKAVNKPKVSP